MVWGHLLRTHMQIRISRTVFPTCLSRTNTNHEANANANTLIIMLVDQCYYPHSVRRVSSFTNIKCAVTNNITIRPQLQGQRYIHKGQLLLQSRHLMLCRLFVPSLAQNSPRHGRRFSWKGRVEHVLDPKRSTIPPMSSLRFVSIFFFCSPGPATLPPSGQATMCSLY